MIRVLHIFQTYLPKSEIWAFRALRFMPEVEHLILADQYSNLDVFLHPSFTIIEQQRGIRNYEYHHQKNWKRRLLSRQEKRLNITEILNAYKVDLIHFHFANTVELVAHELFEIDTPYCISFYGYDYAETIHSDDDKKKQFYSKVLLDSKAIFCEGDYSQNRIAQSGVDIEKIHIVPLGLEPVQIDTNRNNRNSMLRLVQIASFIQKKGQLEALQACAALVEKGADIRLTLVGDPRDQKYYDKIVVASRDHRFVQIEDWLNFDEIDAFLSKFDFFIHPSRHADSGDSEGGSPTILLKAMQNGLPIISTTHCDIPYQLGMGQCELLAKENDLEDLQRKILIAKTMTADGYHEISRYVQQRVNTFFDQRQLSTRMARIYSSILDKKRRKS